MKLTTVLAISAFAAMPALAQPQHSSTAPKLTDADIQKIVQSVSTDKTKTQQYCEIGKLNQQMAEADQKNDTKALEALSKQMDDLEQKIGPDFVRFMDALDHMDDRSDEAKQLMAAVETLDKLCPAH